MYRFLLAERLLTNNGPTLEGHVLVLTKNGCIDDILPPGHEFIPEDSTIEKPKGLICPGFVNAHCHLELSAMKGMIKEEERMVGFIGQVLKLRPLLSEEAIQSAIYGAEKEMISHGIVGVGDISNDRSTFECKAEKRLRYHTFLEVFDLKPEEGDAVFQKALDLQKELKAMGNDLTSSIVPHAPYTVSPHLFRLIRKQAIQQDAIISYHNQESLAESELFISHTGDFAKLYERLGISLVPFLKTGKNSLRSVIDNFVPELNTLLVHNTFMEEMDLLYASGYFKAATFCFCPRANLFIEGVLPNFPSFYNAGVPCAVGTDSYASNHSLDILAELKVIAQAAPEIPTETLLQWATLNGALALRMDDALGRIEKGKTPGINLIEGLVNGKINGKTKVSKLG